MVVSELEDDLEELSSAEDFLEYFEVAFDPHVVHVNRLHILQRFHDYLDAVDESEFGTAEEAKRAVYRRLLITAYEDFVHSDAQTEKVFKVFKMNEPQQAFVSLDSLVK